MRRTKEEAEITRLKIIKTAVHVFNKNGYAASKLEEVAKKAGVTRGAIYHHFSNKKELFGAICHENKRRILSIIDELHKTELSPLEGIKKALNLMVEKLETDKEFRDTEELLFKTEFSGAIKRSDFQNKDEEEINHLKSILQRALNNNELSPGVNVEVATMAFVTFYFGILGLWFAPNSMFDLRKNRKSMIDILFTGLENQNK